MARLPESSLLVLGLCAVAVGTWIINEATRKTTASPARASSLQSDTKLVEEFENDERAAFAWFNRMLVEGGKQPVSDQATIADSDLRRFVRAVRDKQDVTDAALMSWRIAANKRSRAAGQQIDDDIRAGRTPAYPVLT